MTIWSHPPDPEHDSAGIELSEHLQEVATEAALSVPDSDTVDGVELAEVASVAGWCHDIGKASGYFQDHLDGGNPPDRLRYHAPFGAVVAFYVGKQRGWSDETALLSFLAVAKHHGTLPDVVQYVDSKGEYDHQQNRLDQLDSIEQTAPELFETALTRSSNGAATTTGLAEEIDSGRLFTDIKQTVRELIHATSDAFSDRFYEHALLVWSSLVVADKLSAAQLTDSRPSPGTLTNETITEKINDLQEGVTADDVSTLNYWRDKSRDSARKNASLLDDGGVATLTLPTGYGKTFAGVSAALETLNTRQNPGRLIYVLPYTSIIDQTAATFKDVFGIDETSAELTVHHYLSDTVTTPIEEDEEVDTEAYSEKAYLLGETWQTASVITTYVQLLESLAGPRNSQALKLPALQNSVIILDEPQSIPTDWWHLVKRLINLLTEHYNCSVIAMTATQPALFTEDYIEPDGELIDNPQQYFDALERVNYQFHDSLENYIDNNAPLNYSSAGEILADSITTHQSTLAICNTIDSAEELYTNTKTALRGNNTSVVDIGDVYTDLLDETPPTADEVIAETKTRLGTDSVALAYVTTSIRPVDRQCIIEVAEQLATEDVPFGLVSTQVVEAGVDISFARVYRDLAPMDSIVQAAGRCNRSFEFNDGVVTVWWLDQVGDSSFIPSEIYSRWSENLPKLTVEALTAVDVFDSTVSETVVAVDAVEQYYDALAATGVGDLEYPTYLDTADGKSLSELSLIDDSRKTMDLVVCRTDQDIELVESYREAITQREFTVAEKLKQDLNLRRVSVTIYNGNEPEIVTQAAALDPVADSEDVQTKVVDARLDVWCDSTTGIDS